MLRVGDAPGTALRREAAADLLISLAPRTHADLARFSPTASVLDDCAQLCGGAATRRTVSATALPKADVEWLPPMSAVRSDGVASTRSTA